MDEATTEIRKLWEQHFDLDRKAGWTRIGMYTALGISCFLLAIQFGKEKSWVAVGHWASETFYVHSSHNKAVAAIGATDGESALILFDSHKRHRADLMVSDGRVKLGMHSEDGHPQVELVTTANGPLFRVFDANRNTRVQLSVLGGKPEILMFDEQGKVQHRTE